MTRKPAVAIVGAGSLATSLAVTLSESGYPITEVVCRDSASSTRRARRLARKVGARVVTAAQGEITAPVVWFCVPDRQIRAAASSLAERLSRNAVRVSGTRQGRVRIALHSSGALPSSELSAVKKDGIAVASVHPLMTFVPGSKPSLTGVPFAVEGDPAAIRVARKIVRDLGGKSFSLPASRKSAYHAWATMTSPLLLAFLVTLEDAARVAGFKPADARRKSLPIIRQTLANYARLGPARSFSGPIIRGDTEVVARHLKVLRNHPEAREIYVALARSALRHLPAKSRRELARALQ